MGGYLTATYQTISSLSISNAEERIIGNFSVPLAIGLYQFTANIGLTASRITPYLKVQIYTKTGAAAWVNGALLSGGSAEPPIYYVGHCYTTLISNGFSVLLSVQFQVKGTKLQVCVAVGNQDNDTLSINSVDSN